MKRLFLILTIFSILLTVAATAQDSLKLENFRSNALPGLSGYFNKAELSENGRLVLTATQKYITLQAETKKSVMTSALTGLNDSIVLVKYGPVTELWGTANRKAILLDRIDLDSPLLPPITDDGTGLHPWFFYYGIQFGGDSQKNINLAVNLRLGFYLLKNRWDLATSLSGGVSGNTAYNNSGSGWANAGFMSRVHFPVPKLGLNPNVGAEISVAMFDKSSPTVNYAFVVGLSWFIGIGSIDIGISFGDVVSGSGGVTVMPGVKR